MTSRLIEIILIDNYSRGDIIRFRLENGALLQGTNAAGKTSTLRLIPIAFGAQPSDLVQQSGVMKSFSDFYLPKSTSYIVYQFERGNRLICVVLIPKPEGGVTYRFLDHAFDEALFLAREGDEDVILTHSQWKQRLASDESLYLSPPLGPQDFRQVIQSNTRYRGQDRRKARLMNELRQRFSLAERSGAQILHLDRILTAVTSGAPRLANVKDTLANVMVANHDIPDRKIRLKMSGTPIQEWMDSYDAYNAVESYREELELLYQASIQYGETLEKLRDLRNLVEQYNAKLSKMREELYQRRSANVIAFNHEDEEIAQRIQVLNEHINALEGEARSVQRELDALQATKDSYEQPSAKNQGIEKLTVLAMQLSQSQERLSQAREHYNKLTQAVQDITALYQHRIAELEKEISEIEKAYLKQRNARKDQTRNELSAIDESIACRRNLVETLAAQELERIQKKVETLRGEQERLKQALKDSSLPVEIQKDIESNNKEIDSIIQDLQGIHREAKQSSVGAKVARDKRDHLLKNYAFCQQSIREIQDQQQQLRERTEKGTLLSYLDANVPEYAETIGRVIEPKLLKRKDLNPSIGEVSNTIYGLKLNLNAVEVPAHGLSETYDELTRLDGQLVGLETELQTIEKSIKAANIEVSEAELQERTHDTVIRQYSEQMNEFRADNEVLKARGQQAVAARHQDHQRALDTASIELTQMMENRTSTQNKKRSDLREIEQEASELKAAAKKSESYALELAAQAEQQEIQRIRTQIEDAKQDMARDIEFKGVSTEAVSKAQAAVEAAKRYEQKCQSATTVVSRYQRFIKEEWPHHRELKVTHQGKVAEAEQQKSIHARVLVERDNAKKHHRKALAQMDSEQLALNKQLEDCEGSHSILRAQAIPNSETKVELRSSTTADGLRRRIQQLIHKLNQHRTEGRSNYHTLQKQVINKFPSSQVTDFYNTAMSEFTAKGVDREDLWHLMAERMFTYLTESHPDAKGLVINGAMILGAEIADFGSDLKRANDKIQNLSRRMTASAEQIVKHFGAIESMAIQVGSRLTSLDYWSTLHSFAMAHNGWVDSGGSDALPPPTFREQLRELQRVLKSQELDVNIAEQFEISITVNDQGHQKTTSSDKELADISSNGMSTLVITTLYLALLQQVRNSDVACQVTLALDEVGAIAPENLRALQRCLEALGVVLVSAAPKAEPEVVALFDRSFTITPDKRNGRRYVKTHDAGLYKATQVDKARDILAEEQL